MIVSTSSGICAPPSASRQGEFFLGRALGWASPFQVWPGGLNPFPVADGRRMSGPCGMRAGDEDGSSCSRYVKSILIDLGWTADFQSVALSFDLPMKTSRV